MLGSPPTDLWGLFMPVIDFNDDLGAALSVALDGKNPAEMLKTASFVEPWKGHDRDYALILRTDDGKGHRKFACHDPGNVLTSMYYLAHVSEGLTPAATKVAAANLKMFAEHYGLDIPDEIDKLASAELSDMDRRDVLDQRMVRYREPAQAQASRVDTPWHKLAAAEAHWDNLTPHQRREVAVELDAAPGVEVPSHIYRYSGDEVSTKLANHIRPRMALVLDNDELLLEYDSFSKLASDLLNPQQAVEALYELDTKAGIRWTGGDRYGERLADPVLSVYDREKVASWAWSDGPDYVGETDMLGFAIPQNKHVFTLTFTDGLWERFVKDPIGTFNDMPIEQKRLLSRMARQSHR